MQIYRKLQGPLQKRIEGKGSITDHTTDITMTDTIRRTQTEKIQFHIPLEKVQ